MDNTPEVRHADLRGKNVVITGGAKGIGFATAQAFVRQGARVALLDMDPAALDSAVAELREAGGEALAAQASVTDADAVERAFAQVEQAWGGIDVLVNNAGISARAPFDDPQTPLIWERVMNVNLQGTFNVTHAFVEQLKASRGAIVNLCSIVAYGCGISTAGYVVSKGGVRSFTEVLARDLAPHGVRVNAVAPGIMMSEMAVAQLNRPGGADWFMNRVMMKRIGETREIVDPVVFLASDMASFITGAVLPVDGGFLAA